MSNHNYTKENPPVITRKVDGEEVKIPLSETKFGKTSDYKGQSFWTISTTAANQALVRKFLGDDVVNSVVDRFIRRVAMDIFIDKNGVFETKDEHGHIVWDNVLKAFAEFDSGGATLSDLNDQRDELIDINYSLMEDPNYEKNEDDSFVNPVEGPKIHAMLLENIGKLKKLKSKIQAIEEKYAKIAAKRAATKEAKVAA